MNEDQIQEGHDQQVIQAEQENQEVVERPNPMQKNPRDTFMIRDFDHVADAYFNSINLISNFFRYYILIMTVPVPAVAIALQSYAAAKALSFFNSIRLLFPVAAILLALIGMLVMCYLVALRLDGLLYVRHVNGIREHFMSTWTLNEDETKRTAVLPRSIDFPEFYEPYNFIFVVVSLTILNSFYFGVGLGNLVKLVFGCIEGIDWLWGVAGFVAFYVLNRCSYHMLTKKKEKDFKIMTGREQD